MKQLKQSVSLQYVLSSTVLSFSLFTQEWSVTTDGGYSILYGFPFPYISEMWIYTGHHSVFVTQLAMDFGLYFCFCAIVFFGLQKKNLLPQNTFLPKLILVLFILSIILDVVFLENTYTWGQDIELEVIGKAFHFGFYP